MMPLIYCSIALISLGAAFPTNNVETRGFDKMAMLSDNLSKRSSLSDTRNELEECKPVTVIFARGTIEPGNVGALAGPPFFNALGLALGDENIGVQGVNYAATILGYLEGGDAKGAEMLAVLTEQAASLCPSTQIVLSGYSQGAQIVHNGIAQIPNSIAAKIAAVVLFGDPFNNQPLLNIPADKVRTFCFLEDLICKDTVVVDVLHLAYSVDAVEAAGFVVEHVKV